MPEKKYYIKNADLKKEIIKSKNQNKPTHELHMMFYIMATNIITKPSFRDIPYIIDDMIIESYIKCIVKYEKFNIDKSNPFSYFTTVITNSFKDFLKNEKSHNIRPELHKEKYFDMFHSKYDKL